MPSDPSKPSQLSCTSCRHRKVKCDKLKPCSACRRSNVECIFPNRPFKPRGRQGGSKARNVEITQRLQRLEGLVTKLGGENAAGALLNGGAVPTPIDSASHRRGSLKERQSSSSGSPRSQDVEQISQPDGSRYLGNEFWSSLSGEIGGLRQLLDAQSEDEEEDEDWEHRSSHSPSATPFPDTLFIFGSKTNATDLRSLHPFAPMIEFLCNTYFQNVDPLFKILHRPSTQVSIAAAADTLTSGSIDASQEALMFSIYFAAVTSMTAEQCQMSLAQDREKLLAQFKYGAETALANAQFLSSTELKSLQAFAIYVMCLRTHKENRTAWTLIGLAIRIAFSLDLQSEIVVASFSPFEAELRRRLWWALSVIDIRSSEDRGTAPMIIRGTSDTRMACNVNDADLDPLRIGEVHDREGCTEMTFSLITHEAVNFHRGDALLNLGNGLKDDADLPMEQREAVTRQFRQHLESKYLAQCDESVPIFWVSKRVAKVIGLKKELLIQYPIAANEPNMHTTRNREENLERATEVLEMSNEAESHDITLRFRWFIKTYPNWHPLAVALAELCSQVEGPLVDRAWAIVDTVFDKQGSRIADSKKGSLWRPIKKLYTRAQAARSQHVSMQQQLQQQQQQALPTAPLSFGDFSCLNLKETYPNPPFKQEDVPLGWSAAPDILPDINLDQSLDQNIDPMSWGGWEDFLQNAHTWDSPNSADANAGLQWSTELGLGAMLP